MLMVRDELRAAAVRCGAWRDRLRKDHIVPVWSVCVRWCSHAFRTFLLSRSLSVLYPFGSSFASMTRLVDSFSTS